MDCVFFQLINSYSHVFGCTLCNLDNQVITNHSNGIYYVKVETRVIMCYCSHSLVKEERVDVNEYWGLEKLFRPINTGCLLQGLRQVCGEGLAKYSLRLWPPPPPPKKEGKTHVDRLWRGKRPWIELSGSNLWRCPNAAVMWNGFRWSRVNTLCSAIQRQAKELR